MRLAEIDCPEKSQSFGAKAKQFTSWLVGGPTVTVDVRREGMSLRSATRPL